MKDSPRQKKRILLGVTGSIAAYLSCSMINDLRKKDIDVTVIATKEALQFITLLSLQTCSNNKVYTDMFELPKERNPLHTSLAESADLILIAPATANVISKLAAGICDDLLTCVVYATEAPVLIAPAMNDHMYRHKVIQDNISKLKSIGYRFIGPIKGRLACGHTAIGHLADVKDIVKYALKTLS